MQGPVVEYSKLFVWNNRDMISHLLEIWCCSKGLHEGNEDSEIIWKHVTRGTGNVSPEGGETQVEYKREICFLWPQEAEPGSKMLHESRFQLKGATFL